VAREGRIELRVTVKGGPEAQAQIEEILQVFNELKARAQAPVDLKLRLASGVAERAKKAREEWERLARAKMKIARVTDPELERSARRFIGIQKSLTEMTKQQFSVAMAGARRLRRDEEEVWRRRTMLLRAGISEREFKRKTGYDLLELSAQRFRYEVTRLDPRVRRLNEFLGQWWQRFGQVALGFTIAYRAMNLFEEGLRRVIGLFGEAISLSGDLAAMQGKMAAYLSLYGQAAGGFVETFRRAQGFVDAFARAAVKATTPMADLQEGFTELLKYGKVVPRSLVPAYTAFFDFIANIAATNRDYAKQIRSEIRGLMTGAHRAGNVLLFVIERRFDKAVAERIKSMIDAGKTLDDVVQEIARHWLEFQDLIVSYDPKKALVVWQDAIRLSFVEAIRAARPEGEEGGLFALPLKRAAERWRGIFEENKDQFALLFKNLAILEEKGISFAERMLVLIARLNNLFTRFHKEILAVAKAFGAMFMLLSARMFGRWMLGSVVRLIGAFRTLGKVVVTSLALDRSVPMIWAMLVERMRKLWGFFTAKSLADVTGWIKAVTNSWLVQLGVVVALWETLRAMCIWFERNFPKEAVERLKAVGEAGFGALGAPAVIAPPEPEKGGGFGFEVGKRKTRVSVAEAFKQALEEDAKRVGELFKKFWGQVAGLWRSSVETFEWPEPKEGEPGKQGRAPLSSILEQFKDFSTSYERIYTSLISKKRWMEAEKLFPMVDQEIRMKIAETTKEINRLREALGKIPEAVGTAEEKMKAQEKILRRITFLQYQIQELQRHREELRSQLQLPALETISLLREEAEREFERLHEKYGEGTQAFYDAVQRMTAYYRSLLPTVIDNPRVREAVEGIVAYFDELEAKAKGSFSRMRRMAESVAQAMQQAFSDFFFNIITANFRNLGEVLKSFVRSIQRAIADLFAEALVTKFLKGPIFSLFGIGGHAEGGIAWTPQVSTLAEEGPEAVVPLKGGAIPVELLSKPATSSPTYITIQALDAQSFYDWLREGGGQSLRAWLWEEKRSGALDAVGV